MTKEKHKKQPDGDLGTPEQQLRRALLAAGGDPALTGYPLGVYLARGVITQDQHNAGEDYARLYRVSIPQPGRRSTGKAEADEQANIEAYARWQEMRGVLKSGGDKVYQTVTVAAVFQELVEDTAALCEGLTLLQTSYKKVIASSPEM